MALHLLITFLCYTKTLCLKITGKVPYNIASEASYVYKSSLKMPKIVNLGVFFKPEPWGQTVLPDMSVLITQKLVESAKEFSNTV